MPNKFYNDFDMETQRPRSQDLIRSEFQRDRDRIIHSSAFRRLQAKTQVFRPGEYDFYRTRLTHSVEAAQIGRGICHFLVKMSAYLNNHFYIDADLVEACCLAHDIGHPPFGHSGEATLHQLMRPYGGFEANAQTLRLITETIFSHNGQREGMSPTRAFMDGIMKYKRSFGPGPGHPEKKFLYNNQQQYLEFVWGGKKSDGYGENASIECQIMEWADDTAYSIGDLSDGVRARFINPRSIQRWIDSQTAKEWQEMSTTSEEAEKILKELVEAIERRHLDRMIAQTIGKFVHACKLLEISNGMSGLTNRYRYSLSRDPNATRRYKIYKKLASDLVFRTSQLCQLEFKGKLMLTKLFKCFENHYIENEGGPPLLPMDAERDLRLIDTSDKPLRARVICDHIAGMSDNFAIRTFRRLFEAEFGSIVDLV